MKIKAQLEAIKPDRVTLYRNESGWTIAKFRDEDGRLFTGKGIIPFELRDGDLYELDGEWKLSEYSGQQELAFTSARLAIPEDKRSLLTYAVAITKGLGDAKEAAIWDAYGADWQAHPDLDGIGGTTADARFNWRETLARLGEEQAKTQAIGFLLSVGCTMLMAAKAWDEWREETVGRVQRDPYELAKLPRVGFQLIDGAIRRALGVGDDDPRRVRAAVMYSIERLAEQVGTLVMVSEIASDVERLTACSALAFGTAMGWCVLQDLIVEVAGERFALAGDYENETAVWRHIKG